MEKVKCPYCGYVMPVSIDADAESKGLYMRCKARHCKKLFEIVIQNGKQKVIKVEP